MAAVALNAASARTTVALTDDQRSLRVTFVAAFIVVLAIALASSAVGLRWRAWFPGAEGAGSLIGGVKAAVSCFMPLLN